MKRTFILCTCLTRVTLSEQDRIKRYDNKLKKLAKDQELATTQRTLSLNVGAANRFIDAAIPDLTAAQKTALRQVHRESCSPVARFICKNALQNMSLQGKAQDSQELSTARAKFEGAGGPQSTAKRRRTATDDAVSFLAQLA